MPMLQAGAFQIVDKLARFLCKRHVVYLRTARLLCVIRSQCVKRKVYGPDNLHNLLPSAITK